MISRGSKGSPGGRPFAQNRGVGPLEPFPSLLRPLAFPLAFPWTPPLCFLWPLMALKAL